MVQDVVNLADKADTIMSTAGDMVYFTDKRTRLAISDNDKVLQIKSQIPSWETASSGLESPLTADLIYNDSIKAIFGTGSDSYIMHDGSNMYLETATGRLVYNTNATFASGKCLGLNSATVTIASGAITGSANVMNVNTESSASTDDLEVADFTGADVTGAYFGMTAGNSSRTVVIKANGTPNPKFLMPADFSLDNGSDFAFFCAVSGLTHNYGIAYSDNAS